MRGSFVTWATWVFLCYPLSLCAQCLLRFLPAYLRQWLLGAEVIESRVDLFSLYAIARTADGPLPRFTLGWIEVLIACAIALLAWRTRGRPLPAGPLLLAISGITLGGNWLLPLYFGRPLSAAALGGACLGIALTVLGLWWAVRGLNASWGSRLALLLFGFALPCALLPLLPQLIEPGRMRFSAPRLILPLAPLAASALISTGLPAGAGGAAPSLRHCLLALSLLLVSIPGVRLARAASDQARSAELAQALAALPAPPAEPVSTSGHFHRGVNFTANGFGYESKQARQLLARLVPYGVREIALVPYSFADRANLKLLRAGRWESDEGVQLLTGEAHRLGMRVMLKPQGWKPREDELATEDRRRRWFAAYAGLIRHYGALAQRTHVDLFCIGVEFGWLTRYEAEWRALIAEARSVYKGPLVYAANHGPEFESIRFWDALDYIGLDNYYPLGNQYSAETIAAKVDAVAIRYGKPVLFTEAGYSSAPGAHKTPWDDKQTGEVSLDEQVRCYEALLKAFWHKPWFRGVYWWKIETDETGGPSNPGMPPWRKPAMETIRHWYTFIPPAQDRQDARLLHKR